MKYSVLILLLAVGACAHPKKTTQAVLFPENAPVKKFDYEPAVQLTGLNFILEKGIELENGEADMQVMHAQLTETLTANGFVATELPKDAHLKISYWSRPFSEALEAQKRLWNKQEENGSEEEVKQLEDNLQRARHFERTNGPEKQYGVAGYVQEYGKRPRLIFSAYLIYGLHQKVNFARLASSWLSPLKKLQSVDVTARPGKNPGCGQALGYEIREVAQGEGRPQHFLQNLKADGPAAKAGLQEGDRLLAMNERPIAVAIALSAREYNKFYQAPIKLTIERTAKTQEFVVRPAAVCQ